MICWFRYLVNASLNRMFTSTKRASGRWDPMMIMTVQNSSGCPCNMASTDIDPKIGSCGRKVLAKILKASTAASMSK